MDWREAVEKGELIAGVLNAVVIIVLAVTHRWWGWSVELAPGPGVDVSQRAAVSGLANSKIPTPLWWGALAVVVVLAGAARWPFAHSSLWWDEVWNVRNATVGKFIPDKKRPGEFRFVESSWAQALWNFRKPTNHPPFTLLSKACHEVWARATRAPKGRFDEFVIRLPNFMVSLATVALLAWLLRAWGFPVAGLVAALLLALHPWHIRYGIDGRAYSLLTFATVAGFWCLWKMLGSGGQRRPVWWWLFGLNQALIVWCHLLSAWICAAFAAAAAIVIWRQFPSAIRRSALLRLLAMNVVGAMVFLQLFLPNLLQALEWGERNQDGNALDWNYFLTTLSQLCFGVDAHYDQMAAPGLVSLTSIMNENLMDAARVVFVAFGLLPVLVLGYWQLWKRQRVAAISIACLIAAAALFIGIVAVTKMYFYHRFAIACVVPFCALLPLPLDSVPQLRGRWIAVKAALVFLICAALQGVWIYQQRVLWERSYAPLREVAQFLQNQAPGRVIGYGFGSEALNGYWEKVEILKESPTRDALEDALAPDAPLYVVYGYEGLNRAALPDGFELLDDPARFFVKRRFYGIDPQFAFQVLQAKRAR
ncbi:MAG: hypothetical protein ACR2OZ_16160 [Verrucomicrobiales bacterium]